MSGRRTSAVVPQPRPRYQNDPKVVAFIEAEMSATPNMEASKNLREIYVPPQIKKGLVGRYGTGEYNPYSPSPVVETHGNSGKFWPQPMSNHRPILNNNINNNNDMESLDSNTVQARIAIVAAKKKMKQLDALKKKSESIKQRPVNRRPRGKGRHYSESSDDERHDTEYRDLDDEGTESYLRSQSTMDTVREDEDDDNTTNHPLSPETVDWRKENQLGFITKSISENGTFETNANNGEQDGVMSFDDDNSFFVKARQPPVFCVIAVTSIQLLLLMLQLAMCGIATIDINPTIGPFPDAFSEWGGKNPYLTLHNNQWWRLITPAFLHVGVAHLMVNMYCQVNACTMFEREWGSSKWLFLYLASEIGCSAFSNLFDPDSIAVGSTGALMGLFAAKLSQVVTFSLFETKSQHGDAIQLHQLSSILCGLTLASLMGALTYIDFSGNLGGLVSGFFAGIYVFSSCIEGCCGRFWWMLIGLSGLVASFAVPIYFFISVEPDERLSEICEYFRSFHPEGYECGCLWN